MVKQIHNLVLTRSNAKEAFGFRIIGGKEQGLTFKVCTVMTGSPANDAGLQVGDFLVSVQGMDVFECDHAQVVTAVKGAGNSLNLAVERGDHIVPNFEEIWPSGKKRDGKMRLSDGSGVEHVRQAMEEGLPGCRDQTFSTVGKPKAECVQYDSPLQCYSEETLKEMANRGTWKLTPEQVALMPPPGEPQKFTPQNSAVLAALSQDGKGRQC